MTNAPLAVFDVDRTCVDGMTGFIFSSHLFSRRLVGRAARWDVARTMLLYHLNLVGEEEVVRIGATVFRDLPEKTVRRAALEAYQLRIRDRMLTGAISEAGRLADRGIELILASGSSRYIIERIGDELGAADVVATDNEVQNGVCTHKARRPYCFKQGKLDLLADALKPRGLEVEQIALFTDNHSDLPLLERVADPHVVNPEPVLFEIAQKRGWPVHRWSMRLDGRQALGTSFPIKMSKTG